jgi:lipocalin-like protein
MPTGIRGKYLHLAASPEAHMRMIAKNSTRWPILITAGLLLASTQTGSANDRQQVIGFWKLVSYVVEIQATGQIEPVMGRHPTGYVNFSPEGRVMFILTGEGRKPAKTTEERADLLNTLVAYTGTYRIEGDRWITKVDVAWNPEWVGTEQARNFKIDGDRLQVLTPWRVMPNWPEKGMQRSIVTFERPQ